MTRRNHIPSDRNAIWSANNSWEREPGYDGLSLQASVGIDTGNSPFKGQPPQARTKNFKRVKPKILTPIPGLYCENTSFKMTHTCTPTFTAVLLPIVKIQTQEVVHLQIES